MSPYHVDLNCRFKGRMGDPGARIYPASPATVAASAIAGHIATAANRLCRVDQVRAGDIIVGGVNYGTGSSHPAARSLRNLGIAALLAESINGLLFRNAVNFGLLALECRGRCGISGRQTGEVSLEGLHGAQPRHERPAKGAAGPAILLDLMTHGLYSHLERQGLIAPSAAVG